MHKRSVEVKVGKILVLAVYSLFKLTVDDKTLDYAFHGDEAFDFQESFISFLKTNLARDELVYIQKEISQELSERTSLLFEMIPGILIKEF